MNGHALSGFLLFAILTLVATYVPSNKAVRKEAARHNGIEPPDSVTGYLSRLTHVTHTHSTSRVMWPLTFETIDTYARRSTDGLGSHVQYVVCVDEIVVGSFLAWPWLAPVGYDTQLKQIPLKIAQCLVRIPHAREYILHAMEDQLLVDSVQWVLVAAGLRILEQQPDYNYFRFGCLGGAGTVACVHNLAHKTKEPWTGKPLNNASARRKTCNTKCGCCETGWYDTYVTDVFAMVPLLARRLRWADFYSSISHVSLPHRIISPS